MSEIKLLDCTLRDGGYINDWKFGFHTTRDIIRKLVESQVDYVEVGFLRDCEYSKDNTLFNNCEEIKPLLPSEERRGKTVFSAMALHNKYDVNKLEPYDGKTIDVIRVTFHDYDIDEGLQFITKVKEKGYKVFCNPINIMGYSDEMLLSLVKRVNEIQPYAFSIVDTFGSMMKSDLQRIYSIIEHNLDKNIVIGLHLHENLGLAYSLSQEFINMKAAERDCVIDGSMLGMGRVPGNLCLELIMDYMNREQGAAYDVNPVLDGIDDHISELKSIEAWGYNTAYALSAKYNLHRNYAEFLVGKGRLRAKQINQILASIDANKKTAFDEQYIEKLYEDFQNRQVNDSEVISRLSDILLNRKILIMAPGGSIRKEKASIDAFIKAEQPIIISANFIPEDYLQNYAFFSNAMRYSYIDETVQNIIITSNLLEEKDKRNDSEADIVDYSELSIDDNGKCDNCVILLLKLMTRIGVKSVYIAGFDGYTQTESDYIDAYMSSSHTKGGEENIRNKKYLCEIRKKLEVNFLTDSLYEK